MDDDAVIEIRAVGVRFLNWFWFRTRERCEEAKEERGLKLGSSYPWLTVDDDAVEVQAVGSSDY